MEVQMVNFMWAYFIVCKDAYQKQSISQTQQMQNTKNNINRTNLLYMGATFK